MNTSSTSPWARGASHRSGPFPKRSIEIGAIVVSFIYVWPVAVAYVAWKIAGYPALDQMREFARSGAWSFGSTNGQSRFARAFEAAKGNTGFGRNASGNWAFEEYRNAELERLEARRRALQEESQAFAEFVEELKRAKDREQFDAFMAKRRAEGGGPTYQA
ncbi:DUF2852 domain-containing protein [Methylorubrum sp. SB2]|uniref:DUF2852 domain-containing protein n=1 Tax=Methylorubrum subtropicum TaxID=3138812 RepID=UPI00313C45BA